MLGTSRTRKRNFKKRESLTQNRKQEDYKYLYCLVARTGGRHTGGNRVPKLWCCLVGTIHSSFGYSTLVLVALVLVFLWLWTTLHSSKVHSSVCQEKLWGCLGPCSLRLVAQIEFSVAVPDIGFVLVVLCFERQLWVYVVSRVYPTRSCDTLRAAWKPRKRSAHFSPLCRTSCNRFCLGFNEYQEVLQQRFEKITPNCNWTMKKKIQNNIQAG